MITPSCVKCHKELTEPGGLLLGPPTEEGMVAKYHLCVRCFTELGRLFLENLFKEE